MPSSQGKGFPRAGARPCLTKGPICRIQCGAGPKLDLLRPLEILCINEGHYERGPPGEPRAVPLCGEDPMRSAAANSWSKARPAALHMRQLMACLEIGKALTSTFDMEEILHTVLSRLSLLVPAKNWSLLLLDQATASLRFEVVVGLAPEILKELSIPLGEGIAGTVALSGEPVLVEDVSSDPRFSDKVDKLSGFRTRALICLPLKIRDTVIGVVEIVNPQDSCLFRPESMTILSILADYLAIAIGNSMNYKKIAALSMTDTVTGYYNTRFLHEFLENLLEPGRAQNSEVSLVFVDMDEFKSVVDTHGHLLGSKVLKEVADVMASRLGPTDRLVRYGGDEFVILMEGCGKLEAMEKAEEIRKTLTGTHFLKEDGLCVRVTASFGLATYPQDAPSKEELMRLADQCMFFSKKRGKDKVTVYSRKQPPA